jgi:3-methyladenine DNA glycosylase AlkD
LFARFPSLIPEYTEQWMHSGNMWLKRTAILKAIGWLRQYAKTDEQAVVQFFKATPLAPLSVREALKHVKR